MECGTTDLAKMICHSSQGIRTGCGSGTSRVGLDFIQSLAPLSPPHPSEELSGPAGAIIDNDSLHPYLPTPPSTVLTQ